MSKNTYGIAPEIIERFERQIAAHPDIVRKGAAVPYLSVNGHMFGCMNKAGEVGIRLSKEDRLAFLEDHGNMEFKSYGATMREYVTVPDALLDSIEAFQPYLTASFKYVSSLKPKATTRKK